MTQWWQSLPVILQQLIIAIVAAIVAGLIIWVLGFPLRHFITRQLQNKREQDNKLQVHFSDIKKEAIAIMELCNNLVEWYGSILINLKPETLININHYVKDFGVALLPVPEIGFSSHFPEETSKLAKHRNNIEKHNRRRFDLDAKIKKDFELNNISVVNADNSSKRPFYIYDNIYKPLFKWWQDPNKQTANPWPDFNKIGTKKDGGPYNLFVDGWGSQAIAYGRTTSGQKKCKSIIRKIAFNMEYQKEVSYLTISAYMILETTKETAQQLKNGLNDIDKFWPGTKSYRFKKEVKNCPKCKEIFG